MKEIAFPQYRRYLNGASYFRIDSYEQFEELRRMGRQWLLEQYTAKILPDRNLVHDLLFDYASFAEEIAAEAYEAVKVLAR